MPAFEFILFSAAVSGILLTLAYTVWNPKQKKRLKPEVSRWRTFHVNAGVLHGRASARQPAVTSLKGDFELHLDGKSGDGNIILHDEERVPRLRLVRGLALLGKRWKVFVDRKRFLKISPGPSSQSFHNLHFESPDDEIEIQGCPKRREYEIRRKDRLVAIVSRQGRDHIEYADISKHSYLVETLKTESCLPLLSIALGLEWSMGPAKTWDA